MNISEQFIKKQFDMLDRHLPDVIQAYENLKLYFHYRKDLSEQLYCDIRNNKITLSRQDYMENKKQYKHNKSYNKFNYKHNSAYKEQKSNENECLF